MNEISIRSYFTVMLAAVGLAGCNSLQAGQSAQPAVAAAALIRDESGIRIPENSPLRKALQMGEATEQNVIPPIEVPGIVEVDPAHMVKVVPPVSGRITSLRKSLGDSVRKGETLFTMDSADIAQAHSDSVKSQAALGLARKNLERQQELAKAQISARKELEQAESDHSQARSEADRSRDRLAMLGSRVGRGNGRQYTMASPLSGSVIELNGAQGGFWNDTNAPVMTLANLSSLWIAASVQEKDIAAVFVGQEAVLTLNAFSGETFRGKVRYMAPVMDPETRTVKVRIAIDNSSGRFRPGMFGKVVFSGKSRKSVVVPAKALVQSGLNTRVFVEKSPWQFEVRNVKTGVQIGEDMEIVSGLKAGERVVIKEGVLLND